MKTEVKEKKGKITLKLDVGYAEFSLNKEWELRRLLGLQIQRIGVSYAVSCAHKDLMHISRLSY